MENNDAIIYSVKIDQTELIKQASEIQQQITSLANKQKELDAAGEKNSATFQENASLLRVLKREQSDVNRQLDNSVKSFNASSGSITQQRANLSLLTKQYNDMSAEQRNNVDIGGKLQKQIKGLSDELKKNEGAVGDNRRNVGNYEGALTKVLGSMGGFGKVIEGATTTFKGFNTALSTNPLGLILTAVIPLITAFSKFQPVVDVVNVALGAVSNTVDVLVARFGKFTNAIGSLLNGDFEGAAKGLTETFDGLGTAIADAATAGAEYAAIQKEIEDQNQILAIQNAEAEKQIAVLTARLRDRTLTEKERLNIAKQIGDIETENFNKNNANIQKELQAEQKKVRQLLVTKGLREDQLQTTEQLVKASQDLQIQDSAFQKLVETQVKFTNNERESFALQERIAVRRNQILDQAAEKEIKRQEAAQKAQEKADQAAQKSLEQRLKRQEILFQQTEDFRAQKFKEANEEIKFASQEQELFLLEQLTKRNMTQEQFDAALLTIQLGTLEKEKEILIQKGEVLSDIDLQIARKKKEISDKSTNDLSKSTKAQQDLQIQSANALNQIINEAANAAGEAGELQKAAALTQLSVNLGTALSNLTATTSAPTPDNVVTGGISGFVKYATFLAQILSTFTQARGLIGGAAAGGGTFRTKGPTLMLVGDNPGGVERVTVEPLSGKGKTIVNPRSNLVAMAGGGTLIADGGASSTRASQPVRDAFNLMDMFSNLPAPILKVTDLNKVQSNKAAVAKVSELS